MMDLVYILSVPVSMHDCRASHIRVFRRRFDDFNDRNSRLFIESPVIVSWSSLIVSWSAGNSNSTTCLDVLLKDISFVESVPVKHTGGALKVSASSHDRVIL